MVTPPDKVNTMKKFPFHAALLSTVAMICLSSFAGAQEQRKIVLSEKQFRESFLQKVTVSGGIRAGFMFKSTLNKVDVHDFFIYLPYDINEQEAMLCVNMVSRDGRYTASWEYALGRQPSGAIAVNLPSKYQEQISGYSTDDLVVLAAITNKDCLSGEMHYVPSSWGETDKSEYILYVNSGSEDTVVGIPGRTERVQCEKIKSDSTVAFDTKCTIGKDLIGEAKSVYLLRNNFGKRLPNVEVQMR
jgi:hypothetical protein